MAPRIYLIGQRFGYLTVTKQVEPQLYQWRKRRAPLRVPQYEVKCDCGRVKITKAKLLRNGSVKKLWVPAISGQNLSCTRRQALVVYAFQRQRSLALGKLLEIVGKLQPACRINGAASLARFLPAYLGLPSEPVRIVDVHGNPR